jgi:hypothetical protein
MKKYLNWRCSLVFLQPFGAGVCGGCLLFLRYCPITGEDSGMKIEYQDYGSVANIVVTSTVFEFRRHNRAIDVALFWFPA